MTINISASVDVTLSDETNPYYMRTILTPHINSTTRFERVMYSHLGFHAYSDGKRKIRRRGNLYTYIGNLEPNIDAYLVIPPFKLCLENLGDSFMGVHVRLPDGISSCKMTILQEQYQPKAPKVADDFVEFEGIWYCTVVMNCLQTVRIEELGRGDYDTQPLAEEGDSK